MRGFEGFVRRAVVIVPEDEELKARTAKREEEEGKDVPDSALLEMKGLLSPGTSSNLTLYRYLDLRLHSAQRAGPLALYHKNLYIVYRL